MTTRRCTRCCFVGNLGGIDANALCTLTPEEIAAYTQRVLEQCKGNGGYAIGSGNLIPDYVPAAGYLAMINTVRRWRGETIP